MFAAIKGIKTVVRVAYSALWAVALPPRTMKLPVCLLLAVPKLMLLAETPDAPHKERQTMSYFLLSSLRVGAKTS